MLVHDDVDASKIIFMVTENLLFDFELFIGGRGQLVSDIDWFFVTWLPQRKFFVATENLLFDFELFIGGRRQLVSDYG